MIGAIVAGVAERTYRLIVEGELGDDLAFAFPGMALTRTDGSTVLTGSVRDQPQLFGLLQRATDLGLTLLEAKVIDDRPDLRSPRAGRERERSSASATRGPPGRSGSPG